MAKEQMLSGVTLDFDAVVAADDKLMKHVSDWHPIVGVVYDQIDKALAFFNQPLLDREALKHPGEYFDRVLATVKAMKATTPKAVALKSALVWLLDWVHTIVHPLHTAGA